MQILGTFEEASFIVKKAFTKFRQMATSRAKKLANCNCARIKCLLNRTTKNYVLILLFNGFLYKKYIHGHSLIHAT